MALTDIDPPSGGAQLGEASRRRGLRLPEIGHQLDDRQRLACAFRILAREGLSEGFNGHITCVDATANLLVNPWGYWWDEVRASDLIVVSPDGDIVEGDWDVTPAIFIHTEVHKHNPDAKVVIHNHPYYATLLASIGDLPRVNTQTSCLLDGEVGSYQDFGGPVLDASSGGALAEAVGSHSITMLWSHGVLVSGRTIEEATFRMVALERASRLTYDMLAVGREPLPIERSARAATKSGLLTIGVEAYWVGAVRRLLRDEPDVLE